MVDRTLIRTALVLAGAVALTVAVPASACDCDARPQVAATAENAAAAAGGEDGATDKNAGPCSCQDATAPAAARLEASAASTGPALDLQFWWTKPQNDGC